MGLSRHRPCQRTTGEEEKGGDWRIDRSLACRAWRESTSALFRFCVFSPLLPFSCRFLSSGCRPSRHRIRNQVEAEMFWKSLAVLLALAASASAEVVRIEVKSRADVLA